MQWSLEAGNLPMKDLLDFLARMRAQGTAQGTGANVMVVPVGADAAAGLTQPQVLMWTRAIDALADPHIYLEAELTSPPEAESVSKKESEEGSEPDLKDEPAGSSGVTGS